MALDPQKIIAIYSGKVAHKYDYSMPPFFVRWKKIAFNKSALKSGDKVLVFCCGTGLDFKPILHKIGKKGKIVAIDFSSDMLELAKIRIEKNKWNNIELIEADITKFEYNSKPYFDAGVCTLGLSIIPDYLNGYYNLLNHVKPGGQIIIGDMQLATGFLSIFNPVTVRMAKKFGGTVEGHNNSVELQSIMNKELQLISTRSFFFGAYYFFIGRKT